MHRTRFPHGELTANPVLLPACLPACLPATPPWTHSRLPYAIASLKGASLRGVMQDKLENVVIEGGGAHRRAQALEHAQARVPYSCCPSLHVLSHTHKVRSSAGHNCTRSAGRTLNQPVLGSLAE